MSSTLPKAEQPEIQLVVVEVVETIYHQYRDVHIYVRTTYSTSKYFFNKRFVLLRCAGEFDPRDYQVRTCPGVHRATFKIG